MFYAFMGNCFNTLAPTEEQNKNKAKACFALESESGVYLKLEFVGA